LGTWDIDTMQAQTSIRVPDTSTTPRIAATVSMQVCSSEKYLIASERVLTWRVAQVPGVKSEHHH
jgi:hypothetical protein